MKRFLIAVMLGLALWPAALAANEVDEAEVYRLGDTVQHITGGHQSGPVDAFVEAMRPPVSDADKWFISVISTKGCEPCARLKQEWRSNPWLLALADPADPKKSWAHYNEYDIEDKSQAWRFENLNFDGFPAVVVQTPRSGKYGDPATVVYQNGYAGDPRKLAGEIVRTIKQYVGKVAPQVEIVSIGGYSDSCPGPWCPDDSDSDSGREPWRPFRPDGDRPQFQIPPIDPSPLISFPWSSLVSLFSGGFSWLAVIAIALWGWTFWRAQRKNAGKKPIIDDDTFSKLLDSINKLVDRFDGEEEPATTPQKKTTKKTTRRS